MKKIYYIFIVCFLFGVNSLKANYISANSSNYISYLNSLLAGDTLFLASGNYINNLSINNINGTASQPIVIMGNGNTTIFQGQSCCNTISITQCSYIIIKNMQLDGLNKTIDAVKGEGTAGNWAHHITLEYLHIINYGSSQQNVGISTKCSAWNWTIRKNKIIGAGTGMYLGNSAGDKPFVNGIIEYNYIANTIGYNIEIKHQFDTVRDDFAGTSVNGKTIIRHNVFTKDNTAATGGNARPNLLVGGFPLTGWGSTDYYEIFGNFFYNNPTEALFQGTGNIMLYENIFVNHTEPSGARAIYITPQNGVSPQDIKIFHNTVWAINSSGGIRLYNPNTNYKQYCYGNAVFAPSPITNFTDSLDNITDDYNSAGTYVLSANTNITSLDLYPKNGQLTGTLTPNSLFQNNTNYNTDFNGDSYSWTYRGAYSGNASNNGWHLQLDTMSTQKIVSSGLPFSIENNIYIYPNPTSDFLTIQIWNSNTKSSIQIYNLEGKLLYNNLNYKNEQIDIRDFNNGIYILKFADKDNSCIKKIVVNH